MPIYEHFCHNVECERCGLVEEHYFSSSELRNPDCEACGQKQRRVVSMFNSIWDKNIAEYGLRDKETYWKDKEIGGHWVQRKQSTRRPDGQPEWELITTRQQQKQYCKEEGYVDPADQPVSAEISKDGRTMNSQGMPGSWV